ncbi:hypothetical protein [Alsobacter sp. R-9]
MTAFPSTAFRFRRGRAAALPCLAVIALAAACTATPATAQRAPGRWTVGILDRTQGSISVVSRDRQFGLEANCRRGADGKVRYSLFLFMPKQWTPQVDWTNAVIDGAPVSLQNDGSEDGIGLSDAISDNQIAMSAELRSRVTGARTIEIPGTSRRQGLADVASFEPADPQGVLPRWNTHCAGLGPEAATTPLPPFSAPPAAAAPRGPETAQAQVRPSDPPGGRP